MLPSIRKGSTLLLLRNCNFLELLKNVCKANIVIDISKATHPTHLLLRPDPAKYEPITFLCRPWHNASGEVNYKIAEMMISGVFVQVS